ncbi:hypothetical protein FIBSPDRAFT_909313 [Athelia psychrophila]|uniref:Uncharacterized protein n=1 Tax=Athelia psychrophila TaxID=1759441 RepID=A0A166PII4_9AGAM|nr:hypothetical protein FIBSPDRAFT_909313 [Fibularhizoctonia sp. CBS 109695]
MVAQTRGYWARDYSLTLGWNNMRYIIETALLHGALLNRTVILPSFVYARSCEQHSDVCSSYSHQFERPGDWRHLDESERVGWRLPIGVMLDLDLLRSKQPVVTVSEYIQLNGISAEETSDGSWDRKGYHDRTSSKSKGLSLGVIENSVYDPPFVNRVDVLSADMKTRGGWTPGPGKEWGEWADATKTPAGELLESVLVGKTMNWDGARKMLVDSSYVAGDISDDALEVFLNENGWEVVYTYNGAMNMDYVKNVVWPIRDIVPIHTIRSFREDFVQMTEDVVLLAGEIHYERKPGSVRFTTTSGRDFFSRIVLHSVRAPPYVYALVEKLANRIQEKVGGRMWVGAHMRRGDFVNVDWAMEKTFEAHFDRIRNRLSTGRDLLRSLEGGPFEAYAIPEATINPNLTHLHPPYEGDPFYLATDERDPRNLAHLASHGALLPSALLTPEDYRAFGWPLLFTDVLGVVEQALLTHAHYFYAHAMSSFAGGVVNGRAVEGMDARTAIVD